ncbi:MAG TPA: hypothetical protein VGJ15_01525 [Pirellulales bacterium]
MRTLPTNRRSGKHFRESRCAGHRFVLAIVDPSTSGFEFAAVNSPENSGKN